MINYGIWLALALNAILVKNDRLTDKYFLEKLVYRDENLALQKELLIIKDFKVYSKDRLINYYNAAEFCGFRKWNFIRPKEIITRYNE